MARFSQTGMNRSRLLYSSSRDTELLGWKDCSAAAKGAEGEDGESDDELGSCTKDCGAPGGCCSEGKLICGEAACCWSELRTGSSRSSIWSAAGGGDCSAASNSLASLSVE